MFHLRVNQIINNPVYRLSLFLFMIVSLSVTLIGQTKQEVRPRQTGTQTQVNRPTPTPTPSRTTTKSTEDINLLPRIGVPPPPPPPRRAQSPTIRKGRGDDLEDDEVIKVDTNLVNLNVRVIDRNNRPITNIRQDEFRVFEDGVPQTIAFFSKQEVPISYGLVVDNSGSLKNQLDKVIDAGKTIIKSNKSGDETFIVRFIDSEQIEELQDFTSKQEDLLDSIENMYSGPGRTAVIDAVYLASEKLARYKKGDDSDRRRRALILVTDGEDRSSHYKQEQLFAQLRESNVQIYIIGFTSELDKEGNFIKKSSRQKAEDLLEKLAKETGGRVFYPQSTAELPKIAEDITKDMRTQFVIGYSPTNKARDGSYRAVRVTVANSNDRDKRIVITRPGYTAPRDNVGAR
jgi:Ca-activated chloride channel homolog